LIYFDEPTQERVIQTLDRLLAADGLLFVGPAEPFLLRHKRFTSTRHSHAFAYQKAHAPAAAPAIRMDVPQRKPLPRRRRAVCAEKSQTPKRRMIETTDAPANAENDLLASASRSADAGRLAEAAELCETHLRDAGPTADGYYLLGVVRDAMRLERQAEECYRKAIYLAPEHYEALLHLALLAQKRGDLATARRLQSRARRAQEGAVA
jgi:chemotaxis protein methyltransferase WspC